MMIRQHNNSQYKDDTIPLFLSFCIEQYAFSRGINGSDAMKELLDSGTLKYLEDNYEVIKKIYESNTYRRLAREETKLWHYGPVALFQYFQEHH